MFYVKTRINKETDLTTDITEENVFTRCPDCGAELRVDLPELASDKDFDLYGIGICCPACSRRRWEEAHQR